MGTWATSNNGEATNEAEDKQQGQPGRQGFVSRTRSDQAEGEPAREQGKERGLTVSPAWVDEDRNREQQRQHAQDKGEQESASGTSGRDANARKATGTQAE